MIELLESAANSSPTRTAVVSAGGASSYAELLADAKRVAWALQHRGISRFAVVEPDAGWILRLLAGAALVGAEPCQYQADITPGEFADQAESLGHTVVVTGRTDLGDALDVLEPAELTAVEAGEITAGSAQPLMIRTTGTTGRPKAARHDWRHLRRTVACVRPRPEQRWLLAYGPHQFAGVQVLQHVLASQATLVAPYPRQPRDGLDALVSGGVTCLSATPTYWRFLLAEARSRSVALPPLEQITLGGEASPADLLEDLRATFPGANLSQVYASTEFGSIASVKDGRPGFAVDALFSEANPTSNLRVVDGELWVRAGAGMLGYADGESRPVGDDWHPTGDLVDLVGDRVVFRGRDSEVINVGGVKVHPLPVEERVLAVDGVTMARVFGRANRLTGAIVAAEVVADPALCEDDRETLRAAVKAAVADLPPAWRPRSITFVEGIETQGDKTVRRMEP